MSFVDREGKVRVLNGGVPRRDISQEVLKTSVCDVTLEEVERNSAEICEKLEEPGEGDWARDDLSGVDLPLDLVVAAEKKR